MNSVQEQTIASPTQIQDLFARREPTFWEELKRLTNLATTFAGTLPLTTLRKKGLRAGIPAPGGRTLRAAMVGGCSLYPLHDLVSQFVGAAAPEGWVNVEWMLGNYDNYNSEIRDADSAVYEFKPEVIVLIPAERMVRSDVPWTASRESIEGEAKRTARELLDLCELAHQRSGAEIILTNFLPYRYHDPGPYRVRTLASDWNFRKFVNLELGLGAPAFVHICDVEFLATWHGAAKSQELRSWFESKQLYAPDFAVAVAREIGLITKSMRHAAKKVLALDLDNTLWGGVIGDDLLEGIELGDTNARGEAFKAFQQGIASLGRRGVLLAVASKNDREKAVEPFEKHPEMVLRMKDIASFQANWEPKSDNLRRIAAELNVGADSLVFVDDNPAEIEIARQFVPEVTSIALGADPSLYLEQLLNARLFDPTSITAEDLQRGEQYRQQAERRVAMESQTDMDSYLRSLEMTGEIASFSPVDVPRIAQLINKSNQFNVTTRRRTEAEVAALVGRPEMVTFTVRLADRFGDHGLISVVVAEVRGETAHVDTWLMSCRVLKRQVENEVVNELARSCRALGCKRLIGTYLPTAKNGMVADLFPRMGFATLAEGPAGSEYELDLTGFEPHPTYIQLTRHA